MKFCTKMPPEGDAYDNKFVMSRDDMRAWVAAGRPALHPRQARALCRTAAYVCGRDPGEVVALARTIGDAFVLSQPAASPPSPSRVPSNPTSSRPTKAGRTAGNPPKKKVKKALKAWKRAKRAAGSLAAGEPISSGDVPFMMASADPELRALYLSQQGIDTQPAVTLDADPHEAAVMMASADPELRALWLAQSVPRKPEPARGPFGMDQDRYQLHREAKQLAQTRCDANPRLDPGEAYCLAAVELEDRKSPGVI